MFGRIWCAYSCPQTILVEVYNWIGHILGGSAFGKKTETKLSKALVWFVWVLFSFFMGFIFISYFNTPQFVYKHLLTFDIYSVNGGLSAWFLFWLLSSTFSFLAFAYFRENICKYVCPYGRFQTVLLDKYSPIVTYDVQRGEPRRQKGIKEHQGDCTSCKYVRSSMSYRN